MKLRIENNIFIRTNIVLDARADIWFIHGFGESGMSFIEAFSSPLAKIYNFYVPDLPGFGVTPFLGHNSDIRESCKLLRDLIRKLTSERPIVIVAHSLGGIIGTWLCQSFGEQIISYANIEGNLTEADAFFSGTARDFTSAKEFSCFFISKVFSMLGSSESLHRYYASVRFAQPEALLAWGKSGAAATGETKSGSEFAKLLNKKIYLWGDQSSSDPTRNFLKNNGLPNHCFEGSGHWPMIEKSHDFYTLLESFITKQK